jgi:hypothetical protein
MWIEMQAPEANVVTRRSLFQHVGSALYGAALTQLLGRDLYANDPNARRAVFDLKPRPPARPPRAKAVIHLFMNGGPSQMDN